MKNKSLCDCGSSEVYISETNYLRGSYEDGVFYLKDSADSDGLGDFKCDNCDEIIIINEDYKIEYV